MASSSLIVNNVYRPVREYHRARNGFSLINGGGTSSWIFSATGNRYIAQCAILFNKVNKIRLRYPILATRAVKLVLQHNEPVGKVCCSRERLHPECLVLRVSGTEQVVVLHPIFTRGQALDSTNSQLTQLASIR
jgi:hypothetical protein